MDSNTEDAYLNLIQTHSHWRDQESYLSTTAHMLDKPLKALSKRQIMGSSHYHV